MKKIIIKYFLLRSYDILKFWKKNFGGHLQKSHIVKVAKFLWADLPRGLEQFGKKKFRGGGVCISLSGTLPRNLPTIKIKFLKV